MCPHSWRVFFFVNVCVFGRVLLCTGQPAKQNTNYDKSWKVFSLRGVIVGSVGNCCYYIWVEMWCQSYRAKIAQGTNSHFILHDEMCVCALQTIPVVRNPLLSTLLHPPFPFFGPTNQLANQSAHLFIDIEQLQWQRRLCLNFPLQYQNDCIDFIHSLVCKYMHTMYGMVSHVFGFGTLAFRSVKFTPIHTHIRIRAYHIRTNYRYVNIFSVLKSKNTIHHWRDGKMIFLLKLWPHYELFEENTQLNLNFIKQLSVFAAHKLAITNFNWETFFFQRRRRIRKRRKVEVKLMKVRFRFYLDSGELKFQLLQYTYILFAESRNGTVIVVVCQLETIYENHSSIIFILFIRESRVNWTVREKSVESKLYISRIWFSILFSRSSQLGFWYYCCFLSWVWIQRASKNENRKMKSEKNGASGEAYF